MPPTVAERREYGVVGDPIAHSLSPAIHQAAYRVLDLPWEYHRFRVPQGELSRFLAQHPGLSGLSVTMPLKAEAFSLSTEALPRAQETGLAILSCAMIPTVPSGQTTQIFSGCSMPSHPG